VDSQPSPPTPSDPPAPAPSASPVVSNGGAPRRRLPDGLAAIDVVFLSLLIIPTVMSLKRLDYRWDWIVLTAALRSVATYAGLRSAEYVTTRVGKVFVRLVLPLVAITCESFWIGLSQSEYVDLDNLARWTDGWACVIAFAFHLYASRSSAATESVDSSREPLLSDIGSKPHDMVVRSLLDRAGRAQIEATNHLLAFTLVALMGCGVIAAIWIRGYVTSFETVERAAISMNWYASLLRSQMNTARGAGPRREEACEDLVLNLRRIDSVVGDRASLARLVDRYERSTQHDWSGLAMRFFIGLVTIYIGQAFFLAYRFSRFQANSFRDRAEALTLVGSSPEGRRILVERALTGLTPAAFQDSELRGPVEQATAVIGTVLGKAKPSGTPTE
jgi:hypothetical protein